MCALAQAVAVAVYLVPIAVVLALSARRDRSLAWMAAAIPAVVAADLLGTMLLCWVLRLELAAGVSRVLWIAGGALWYDRRHRRRGLRLERPAAVDRQRGGRRRGRGPGRDRPERDPVAPVRAVGSRAAHPPGRGPARAAAAVPEQLRPRHRPPLPLLGRRPGGDAADVFVRRPERVAGAVAGPRRDVRADRRDAGGVVDVVGPPADSCRRAERGGGVAGGSLRLALRRRRAVPRLQLLRALRLGLPAAPAHRDADVHGRRRRAVSARRAAAARRDARLGGDRRAGGDAGADRRSPTRRPRRCWASAWRSRGWSTPT